MGSQQYAVMTAKKQRLRGKVYRLVNCPIIPGVLVMQRLAAKAEAAIGVLFSLILVVEEKMLRRA